MSEAPGWDAIDTALRAEYGRQKPAHYGTIIKYVLGGNDPLDGISVYKNAARPRHWHYVSYGLSELYAKESDDPDVSGYGLELTFRLAREAAEKTPPVWALNFLQNLARYVFQTGRVLGPEDIFNLNGPIALEEETNIRAVLFNRDPRLGPIDTPHGRLEFVQVVGITEDEYELAQDWSSRGLLDVLTEDNPLLVTRLRRASVLDDPEKAARIRARVAEEGSSCGNLYNDSSKWTVKRDGEGERVELTLGAAMVPRLVRLLRGRLPYDRDFYLTSKQGTAVVKPSRRPGWKAGAKGLTVRVSPELSAEMQASLRPQRGKYRWPALKGFTLKVVPTEIKDQDGNVTEVIG